MRKRRYLHRKNEYQAVLVRHPIHLRVRVHDGHLRFFVLWRTRRGSLSSMRVAVALSKAESQAFFKRLALGLGYTVPGKTPRLVGLVTEDKHCPVGLFIPEGKQKVYLGLNLHGPDRGTASATAGVTVDCSRRKAIELCKGIAGPLGWDLHEWWEEAA